MKRLVSCLLVLLICFGAAPTLFASSDQPLTDVSKNHWAYKYIADLNQKRILTSDEEGNIRPDQPITRAELSKMIVRLARMPISRTVESSFTDVDAADSFSPYIEAAQDYLHGIHNTKGETLFQPSLSVSREQFAVALVRILEQDVSEVGLSTVNAYKDVQQITKESLPYVALAVSNGWIRGYPDQTFKPKLSVTRAEAAYMIYVAFQFEKNENYAIDGIRIGDSKAKVLAELGRPYREFEDFIGIGMDYDWTTYSLSSNKVDYIHTLDPLYVTPDGIGRHSTLKDVIEAHGEEHLKHLSETSLDLVYTQIEPDLVLFFHFDIEKDATLVEDDQVSGIVVASLAAMARVTNGEFSSATGIPLQYNRQSDFDIAYDLSIIHFAKQYKKIQSEIITILADLDEDGQNEIILTTESSFEEGAAAVYNSATGDFLDAVENPFWLGFTVATVTNPNHGTLLSILAEPKESEVELYDLQDGKLVLVHSLAASRIHMKDSDGDGYEEIYFKTTDWDRSFDRASAYYNYYVSHWDGTQYVESEHPANAYANGWAESEYGIREMIAFYDDFTHGELFSEAEGRMMGNPFTVVDINDNELHIELDNHGYPVSMIYRLDSEDTATVQYQDGREFQFIRTMSDTY